MDVIGDAGRLNLLGCNAKGPDLNGSLKYEDNQLCDHVEDRFISKVTTKRSI